MARADEETNRLSGVYSPAPLQIGCSPEQLFLFYHFALTRIPHQDSANDSRHDEQETWRPRPDQITSEPENAPSDRGPTYPGSQ
jgi:hypothetical protein